MAKPTDKIPSEGPRPAEAQSTRRPPVAVEITPSELATVRKQLTIKLRSVVMESMHSGEVGQIAALINDIRGLDFLDAVRKEREPEPITPDTPEVAARKAAAVDDGLMQAQNRATVLKERGQAAREEGAD